jgi:hypothetical protein
MERCKNKSGSDPSYPHIRAFLRRYGRRAGAGLVAGVVATSAGCDWLTGGVLAPKPEADTGYHLDGMIAETAETWSLELPLDGARDLYFSEPYGWIRYRLAVVVDGTQLYEWLRDNAETDDGYDEVEAAIVTALWQAYQEATGSSRGSVVALDLLIDAYEDEDDILGDMEATK